MVTPIQHVGDKFIVGAIDTSFLDVSSRILPGTSVLNGPVYIGMSFFCWSCYRANCMIGPPLLSLGSPASLEVLGITNIFGILNVFSISTFTGLTTKLGTTIKNALSLKNGIDIAALKIGNTVKVQNGVDNVNGVLNVAGVINCSWLTSQIS